MELEFRLYKEIDITKDNTIFPIKYTKIKKVLQNQYISNLEYNKSEYINLIENLAFNYVGSKNINIDKDDVYVIDFLGEAEYTRVELFVISYSDKVKIKVESISLNNRFYFYPIEEAKSIRFSIKVSGPGTFKLQNIKMYTVNIPRFNSYEEINTLQVDKPKILNDLRVACIFDEFTMNCFKDMVDIIPLTPYNWKLEMTLKKPHILIVESAWEGKDKLWYKKIASNSEEGISILKHLTTWCKNNKIPTIFWNKEDPVHFNAFINACKNFDYIFTTDENSISKYKQVLGHNRVYTMPFACQPKIHNPIKYQEERIDKACFAGTYYGDRFKDRKIDTDNILKASIQTIGLEIFDRQLNIPNTPYKFPKEYETYIKGSLKADELQLSNKGYKVVLNVNSVKNSNTMFSRRVFECVASGTPVVSSYSMGVKNIFEDLVFASDNFNELKQELQRLKTDESYYNKKLIKGIRLCMNNHTYQNRLEYILDKIGIDLEIKSPSVSLLTIINNEEDIHLIKNIYNNQTYKNKNLVLIFKDKELFNKIDLVSDNNSIKVLNTPNLIVKDFITTDYISFINLNNFYGKYYIEDLINATKYCEAEFIGKKSYYNKSELFGSLIIENPEQQFEYVERLHLDKCIFKSNVLNRIDMLEFINCINKNYIDKFKFGYRCFSTDRYNFVEGDNRLIDSERSIVEI